MGRFTRACDLLPTRSAAWDSRSPIVADTGADLEAEAIRMQSWCRAVVAAGNELEIIQEVDRRDGPGGEIPPVGEFRNR